MVVCYCNTNQGSYIRILDIFNSIISSRLLMSDFNVFYSILDNSSKCSVLIFMSVLLGLRLCTDGEEFITPYKKHTCTHACRSKGVLNFILGQITPQPTSFAKTYKLS